MSRLIVQKAEVERLITLIPLAMAVPNSEGVYTFSEYMPAKTVTESEWQAYTPHSIKVGTPDNWRWETAYIKGLDGWYLATEAGLKI